MSNQKVVTRFAPSPTGLLHLGTYRTAIFAYLYAKHHGGEFILRIEDTDPARDKKEYEDNILESFKWLGLTYDKFYRQSEHVDKYKFYIDKLIALGHAYISKEQAKDGSGVMRELVRFKNPNTDVTFHDEIKGKITTNTTDLGDFVIARSPTEPLHHLAVVVDDFEEGVTHVIRGEDLTSNTPRQVLIQRAIGAPTPVYAHLPLVLGPDKLKLSKRRGALPALEYKKLGFLPEGILNGVAFVGWNPGTDKEIFTPEELIKAFDLTRVQKSPAALSNEKLEWFNKEHMKLLPKEEIEKNILTRLPENLQNIKLVPMIFERISKWSDVDTMVRGGELDFFATAPKIEKEKLNFKNTSEEVTKQNIALAIKVLNEIDEKDFTQENIKNSLVEIANASEKRGAVLHPIRYALSGLDKSPDPFIISEVLGKNETLSRLQKASELTV